MSDRKSIAIALGTVVGIAAVATCVGMYISRHGDDVQTRDVNDVFEKARKTVQKLDEAVEGLKKSTAA